MKPIVLLACVMLAACAHVDSKAPEQINGYVDETADALMCLDKQSIPTRFAISAIPDMSNVYSLEGQGGFISNGFHLMLITAMMDGGALMVNRHDTSVVEWERHHAMNKGIGDGVTTVVNKGQTITYRPVRAGEVLGSDYIVSGGITSLDFNRASDGFEINISGVGGGWRTYEMIVGVDIVATDSRTGAIVYAEAFQRSLYGAESKGGAFRMFDMDGDRLFDINMGSETHEPIQAGMRYLAEHVAVDVLRKFYAVGTDCQIQEIKEEKP